MIVRTLGAALAFFALAGPALAQSPMSTVELDANRGGFLVAGQVAFDFGAVVRTFQDGELLLQTQVTWTASGPVINRTGGSDSAMSQFSSDGSRVTLVTPGGASLVQQFSQGQPVNILVNPESGRSFRQETEMTLVLPGFATNQGEISRNLTSLRLADDLAQGSISASR